MMYWVRSALKAWADQSANGFSSGAKTSKELALIFALNLCDSRNIICDKKIQAQGVVRNQGLEKQEGDPIWIAFESAQDRT
jgi:hypothetical protein